MELRVLGPLQVLIDEEPVPLGGPKQRTALALLVAEAGRVVSVDALIDGLWGAHPTQGARSTLQTYVSNLRAALGDVIVREGGGYRLDVDPAQVDAVRFEEAVARAAEALETRPPQAAQDLREALALWRGHPYADVTGPPTLDLETRRLEELRLRATETRIEAELALGHHAELIPELEVLSTEHPLREELRALHVLALYRSGRQTEALRALEKTRRYLAEELGVDPSPRLQELERRVLDHDPSLLLEVEAQVETLAFLLTDIEDSTTLWELHPEAMRSAVEVHDRIIGEAVEAAGGWLVKRVGDGIDVAFADVGAAVEAAGRAQRGLLEAPWAETGPLEVRMAIDVGEVEARAGDYFGPVLNRCGRMLAAAHGGQVLLSADAHTALAASRSGWQAKALGDFRFKGLGSPLKVFQLLLDGFPSDFPPLRIDRLPPPPVAFGRSVRGYELREEAGRGDFGIVYRAYQPSVGREVAVKVIRPELVNRPSFVRRFEPEARLVALLEHPHIAPLHDYWRDPEGAYLVMRWLRGGSLREALDRGPWNSEPASRLLAQVAGALAHAHRQGVVHGDVKPSNILLDEEGYAYLSDFGIALRSMDETARPVNSSPAYLPPEELEGRPLTPRSDLYALGLLTFELLAGTRPPMDGALPSVSSLRPDLPAALDRVIARATASDPADRHESVEGFLIAFEEALGSSPSPSQIPYTPSRNPYKGLRAFTETDAEDFHGRDGLVAELLEAIARSRLVAAVGPSGIGKSSVVRAGVVPALRADALPGSAAWVVADMFPGSHPFDELGTALLRVAVERPDDLPDRLARDELGMRRVVERILPAGAECVLVIDQFEELFTLTADEEVRRRFLAGLTALAGDPRSRTRVILTLRADYLDRPLGYPEFGELLREGMVVVTVPSEDELAGAIERPAEAVGVRFEPGLISRIIHDVGGGSGGLPLLQYALTELFEQRTGDLLTLEGYEAIGGVTGALARRAEDVYERSGPMAREVTRDVFLRLVAVDEAAHDTRRRIRRRELRDLEVEPAVIDEVLTSYGDHRLLSFDRDPVTRSPTVEVAHEALIGRWDRLRGWIDERREDLLVRDRLAEAVREWQEHAEDPAYLVRGGRLAHLLDWAADTDLGLTSEERRFLETSREAEETRRTRRRRRRRALMSAFGVAALVMLVLAVLAYSGRRDALLQADRAEQEAIRAEQEADRARRAEQVARSRELAASAINALADDPALAKLLALSAASLGNPPLEVVSALHRAYAADPVLARYTWPEDGWLWTDLHPSGSLLVASGAGAGVPLAGSATRVEVVDLETGELLWSHQTADRTVAVGPSFFSKDGDLVVAATFWMPEDDAIEPPGDLLGAHVWDADTGELVDRIDLGRCGGWAADLSETHLLVRTLLTDTCRADRGSELSDIELVDLRTGERTSLAVITRGWGGHWGADLSGDGRRAALVEWSGDEAASVVVDLETGERLLEYRLEPEAVLLGWGARKLSHDGSLLISGHRPIEVWDVGRGEVVARFDGHPGESIFGEFAPSGSTVYSTGRDGTLRHWDAVTGQELAAFPNAGDGRPSASESGHVLVPNMETGTASLLSTRARGEIAAIETCAGFVFSHSLQVSGRLGALHQLCEGRPPETHVVDLAAREVVRSLPDQAGQALRLSPDGTRLLRQEGPGTLVGPLRIRDLDTGRELVEVEGMCAWDNGSPLEADQQPPCRTFPEEPFPVWAWQLGWSPDGSMIGVLDAISGGLAVWGASSGELLFTAEPPAGAWFEDLIFTPDSTGLIVSESTGSLLVISTEDGGSLEEIEVDPAVDPTRLGFIGYSADGSALVGGEFFGGADGVLHWFDAATLRLIRSKERVHDGSIKATDISPNRSSIATGSSNGFVRVWDIDTGELVHEIPVGDTQVQGVAFLDDEHLAVSPERGGVLVYTIDVDDLLDIVRASLTRGFTDTECQRFNFGEDCPTLEELLAG